MELNNKTKEYWEEEDLEDLKKVVSLSELYSISTRVIKRIPKPVSMVCGPITTGGLGNMESNLKRLNVEILKLQNEGHNVWDQAILEDATQILTEKNSKDKYYQDVLTDIYLPIFESGYIDEFYFLPDWQSSSGAKWEHEEAKRLGIKINYLD